MLQIHTEKFLNFEYRNQVNHMNSNPHNYYVASNQQYNQYHQQQQYNQSNYPQHYNQMHYQNQSYDGYNAPIFTNEQNMSQSSNRQSIQSVSQSMVEPNSYQPGYAMHEQSYYNEHNPPTTFNQINNFSREGYFDTSTLNQSMNLMKLASGENPSQNSQPRFNQSMHQNQMNATDNFRFVENPQIRNSIKTPQKDLDMLDGQFQRSSTISTEHHYSLSNQVSPQFAIHENPFKKSNPQNFSISPEIMFEKKASLVQTNQKSPEVDQVARKSSLSQKASIDVEPSPRVEAKSTKWIPDTVNEKAERMQNSYDEMPLPTHKRQPTSHSDFNIDDIPIQSKKLTFEELLAQNLKNEDMKSEENVFGKQVKGKPKSMGYLWYLEKVKAKPNLNDSTETQKRSDAVQKFDSSQKSEDSDWNIKPNQKEIFSEKKQLISKNKIYSSSAAKYSTSSKKKSWKTFANMIKEQGYHSDEYDSDAESFDEQAFADISSDLQTKVAKIMVRLKNHRKKRKIAKKNTQDKLHEVKELYEDCIQFKNNSLAEIEESADHFKLYKEKVSY